jgi:phosphopantothenoylcysteine decarboxylase/phosphopantothenate--cysteine ligase
MHPADEIRGIKSTFLKNKRIVLAVTGSIASVETVLLARELIRHGATIIPVMTEAATKIIHPDALWFATGKKPIIELTGDTEHVQYCGRVDDPVDLLLIAPSTANTISKIALGIDDTTVTTFATTAIGSHVPIIIVPAMHLSMYDHDIVQENIAKLKKQNIEFIDPVIKNNKARFASNEEIVAEVIHQIGPNLFDGKKMLIIGGSTEEPIDDVRCLTNVSSGKTAISLATTSFLHGADVLLWYGQSNTAVPPYIESVRFKTITDIKKMINKSILETYDMVVVCAALADFIPEKQDGKIPSDKDVLSIQCHKAEKILPLLRKKVRNGIIIGFKLAESKNASIEKAKELLISSSIDGVIANTISSINSSDQRIWIIDRTDDIKEFSGSKQEVASKIVFYIASVMS